MNILLILQDYIDLKYQAFQTKICPTKYPILGVKIPILRKIAKNLLKQNDYETILKNLTTNSFEEVMLEGFIIANAKISYEEKEKLIKNYLTKIDNWALCDIFVGELKTTVKNNYLEFFNFLNKLLKSKKDYEIRFAVVSLMQYYLDNDHLDFILNSLLEIQNDNYYVQMAIAWCLSTSLSKYFSETITFMEKNKNKVAKWTYNKALQKGRESLKLNKEEKAILQKMKIK